MTWQKGHLPWNTGKKWSKKVRQKISNTLTGRSTGLFNEKNPSWKGDKVSYSALHEWINNKLGKAKLCSDCGTTTAKKFEWANISGKYLRDFSDWVRLCASCHDIRERSKK